MNDDPLTYLRATLDAAQELAQRAAAGHVAAHGEHVAPKRRGEPFWPLPGARARYEAVATGKFDDPDLYAGLTLIEANSPAAVLCRIAADRKQLELHAAVPDHGRFSHRGCDATCDGSHEEPPVCRSCHDYAGDPIEAPCRTVEILAEGWGWTGETT